MPAHFCGVTGLKTTVGRISRAGAMPLSQSLDTVGPLARTAEDCALLLGLMAGADPEDPTAVSGPLPDYMAAAQAADQRPHDRRARRPSMSTISIPKWRACSMKPIATLKREGAAIVQVELPDQRQLAAACQLVLAVEAAAFHKRWMIERPQDYGPQVLMRLQNGLAVPGGVLSRSDALARSGAGGASGGGRRRRCRDRAGGAGCRADHCRKRCRQQPRRRCGDPADHALHAAGQLSRAAVAGDSVQASPATVFRSACS